MSCTVLLLVLYESTACAWILLKKWISCSSLQIHLTDLHVWYITVLLAVSYLQLQPLGMSQQNPTMSNKTFNLSTDQAERVISVRHRALLLSPSPEGQYSNSSTSHESSPVDNVYSATFPHDDMFSSLNQSFPAPHVTDSMNFCNENLSLMHNQETRLEAYQTFHNTMGVSNNLMTPNSAGMNGQLSSFELSWGGCLDNSSYSLSSGEMVMRSNSFCPEDQSHLVSSLEETSHSPVLPGASNLLSATLPDVSERSPEMIEESMNQCLGMTFIKTDNSDCLTEVKEITPSSLVTLPDENERLLLTTFDCESSTEDGVMKAKFPNEADLLPHFPRAITPEKGKSFVSSLSTVQETHDITYTSTPVQNIGNNLPSLPSFSESPCTANLSSPFLNPVKQQPVSVTPKEHVLAVLQVNRAPNFGIESKVMTRTGPQIAVLNPSSQTKPSHMSLNNKQTRANKGSANRVSPMKVPSVGPYNSETTLVCTTSKLVRSAQRQVHEGVGNEDMPLIQTAVDGQDNNVTLPGDGVTNSTKIHNSPIQCRNPTHEAAVVDPSAKHAGNETFCFSSVENLNTRGRTHLKPTPEEGMSVKIEVKTGSAVGQHKPPVLNTRPRFSSASSSLARPPKEKSIPPSFNIPNAGRHPSQTKAGNLNCPSQSKRALQTQGLNKPSETSATEVKKISLLVSIDGINYKFCNKYFVLLITSLQFSLCTTFRTGSE